MAAPGFVLSQPREHDEAVEEVAARHELDRVGHHLAADERGLHALGAHGDAVGHGDRVELHGRATGRADALLDRLRETTLVEVAGHRLDPGRGHADDGLGEVVVGEADGLEHGPGTRAVGPIGERAPSGAWPGSLGRS